MLDMLFIFKKKFSCCLFNSRIIIVINMRDPIYIFNPEGRSFLIFHWILIACFVCLCMASLLRFKFTIISTYKSEIVSIVIFIFLVGLCIY